MVCLNHSGRLSVFSFIFLSSPIFAGSTTVWGRTIAFSLFNSSCTLLSWALQRSSSLLLITCFYLHWSVHSLTLKPLNKQVFVMCACEFQEVVRSHRSDFIVLCYILSTVMACGGGGLFCSQVFMIRSVRSFTSIHLSSCWRVSENNRTCHSFDDLVKTHLTYV